MFPSAVFVPVDRIHAGALSPLTFLGVEGLLFPSDPHLRTLTPLATSLPLFLIYFD